MKCKMEPLPSSNPYLLRIINVLVFQTSHSRSYAGGPKVVVGPSMATFFGHRYEQWGLISRHIGVPIMDICVGSLDSRRNPRI